MQLSTTDLSVFNFIPGRQPNSNLPLKGHLDLPSRLGKTFHDWPNRHGIQPYVLASEIRLGGRDIDLFGYILGDNEIECRAKLTALYELFDSFTGLVPLTTIYGVFNVYRRGTISADFISGQGLKISIPFHEPTPNLAGVMPVSDDAEFGIDYISFSKLGGFLVELSGEADNMPAPKPMQVTAYMQEGFQITKRQARTITLKLFIEQPDYASFAAKIRSLYVLFSAPGLRSLNVANNTIRSFFVKDGFEVHTLYEQSSSFAGIVECKLTEDGTAPGTFTELADFLGNLITDNSGNQILVKL